MTISPVLEKQLRTAAKTWGASFAAWIVWYGKEGWSIEGGAKLTSNRRKTLQRFIRQDKIHDWLKATLASKRIRSRKTPTEMQETLGKRITAIPAKRGIVLVGGEISTEGKQAFRIIADGAEGLSIYHKITERLQGESYCEKIQGLFSHKEPTVEGVAKAALGALQAMGLPFSRGCISLVKGNRLKIVHAIGDEGCNAVDGYTTEWRKVPALRQMLEKPNADMHQFPSCPIIAQKDEPRTCMGVPIFWHSYPVALLEIEVAGRFEPKHEEMMLRPFIHFVRWMLECAITSEEASKRLRWKTLWGDVLFAALASRDFGEAVEKVKRRLKAIYEADTVRVLMASKDGTQLIEQGSTVAIETKGNVVGYVYTHGTPLVVNSTESLPQGTALEANYRSELAVPLKASGKVVGVIDLASERTDAFERTDKLHLQALASHLGLLFEKMRLQEEAHRRARNLALVHQIVQETINQTDEQSIAEITAKRLAEQFGFELSMVVFVDPHSGEITAESTAGVGSAYALSKTKNKHWYMPNGVIDETLLRGETVLIPDTRLFPLYRHDSFRGLSELCVPIIGEDETPIGVINVEDSRPKAFTEEEKVLLESIAGVLSATVSSLRRYQSLREHLQQLEAIRAIGTDISADLDMDTMLQRVVHRVVELLGVQGAEIALPADNSGKFKVVASTNPWQSYLGYSFELGEGVSGRALASGKTVIVDDYPFWEERGLPKTKLPAITAMAVPLIYQDAVLGVLTVYDGRGDFTFGEREQQLLELILPQIAVAIRNAMMYREIQMRIEAQRSTEEQLLRSARLAAFGELASGVAHELNNPLTAVTGFLELALDSLPENLSARSDIEIALKEARRAADTVRSLLDFAKNKTPTKVAANIDDLITETLSLVNHLLHRQGIFLNRTPAPTDTPPLAEVNPAEVKQVILNLVINAIEAMPHGGTLTINTSIETDSQGSQWVVVRIKDTGRGIPPEDLQRVFDPLYTTKPTGTGMGLALSIKTVNRNGGTINVDSTLGKGTTFTVKLPIFKVREG